MSKSRVIFGFHAVLGRLRGNAAGVLEILLDARRSDARARELVQKASSAGVRVQTVQAERLDELARTTKHQGVVARIRTLDREITLERILENLNRTALMLVLDGVQDPHNLGACLRVADAFGADAVIAPKDRAVGLTPIVEKVASGAAETVPYVQVTNLARTLAQLQQAGIWLIGAEQGAEQSIAAQSLTGSVAWILGSEGQGLRRLTRDCCDYLATIPMVGSVGSLNVAVAAGICLYETCRQRTPPR